MLRTFVNGKIHQLKVTGLQPSYNGSCLICPELLAAAGIEPFERVEIYSLTSTARIATYVFPGCRGGRVHPQRRRGPALPARGSGGRRGVPPGRVVQRRELRDRRSFGQLNRGNAPVQNGR